jgi:hypothetical protein
MPYIPRDERGPMDYRVPLLAAQLLTPGYLNYAITTLVQGYLARKPKVGYAELNEVIGVLEAAKLEFYRRRVAPYEDGKIKENGDVY